MEWNHGLVFGLFFALRKIFTFKINDIKMA